MSTAVWTSLIGAIGAIGGAIVGFLLSEIRLGRDRKRLEKAIRQMLYLEINYNLGKAEELQRSLGPYITANSIDWCLKIVEAPTPAWSQAVWLSNLDHVADAVPPHQAYLAFRHYGYLDDLLHQYEILHRLRILQMDGRGRGGGSYTPFNDQSREISEHFSETLLIWIADGNPIRT